MYGVWGVGVRCVVYSGCSDRVASYSSVESSLVHHTTANNTTQHFQVQITNPL